MNPSSRALNRSLYDRFWKRMPVIPPHWFSTWKLVGRGRASRVYVEIGPGTRPRAPLDKTLYLDLSRSALIKLRERGARTGLADGGRLPLRSGGADVVVAFDVLEHVEGDEALFREIGRVVKPGGDFIFSVPLHPELFDRFDAVAGHVRRYAPADLLGRLEGAGFSVASWCAFGSRPRMGLINWAGAFWLERFPSWCAWCRDILFRAVGRHLQAEIRFEPGDLGAAGTEVAGVVVVARRAEGGAP